MTPIMSISGLIRLKILIHLQNIGTEQAQPTQAYYYF